MSILGFDIRKSSLVFWIGFVCIAGIIGFYGYAYFQSSKTKNAPDAAKDLSYITDSIFISDSDLEKKLEQKSSDTVLIDIRSNDFFAFEHVPQSTNIPPELIGGLTVRDGFTFVLIGSAGNEQGVTALAAQTLHDKNAKAPILILRGGFEGWKNSGGRTISAGNPDSLADQSKVTYVSPQDLKKNIDARTRTYLILDMRAQELYAQGHVPGATNLPLNLLEDRYEKIPSGVKVIAYGNSAMEDFQAGVRLFDLGIFSAEILKGGYEAWKNAGYETQKQEPAR